MYLYSDQVDKLKKMAKDRKASALIRDAVSMVLEKKDQYSAGYNRGLQDSTKVIKDVKEVKMLAINGKTLDKVLAEKISELKK